MVNGWGVNCENAPTRKNTMLVSMRELGVIDNPGVTPAWEPVRRRTMKINVIDESVEYRAVWMWGYLAGHFSMSLWNWEPVINMRSWEERFELNRDRELEEKFV